MYSGLFVAVFGNNPLPPVFPLPLSLETVVTVVSFLSPFSPFLSSSFFLLLLFF